MRPGPTALFRVQAGAWIALLGLCAAVLAHAIAYDEEVPFISSARGPDWIMAPAPESADLIVVDPKNPPVHTFIRRFEARGSEGEVHLRGRALRDAALRLNGEDVPLTALGFGWKQGFEASLTDRLRPGLNELQVAVSNRHGPALLQLEFLNFVGSLDTDTQWLVRSESGRVGNAVIARDRALHPESRLLPTPLEIFERRAGTLIALFLAATAAAWWAPRWLTPARSRRVPDWVLAGAVLFWLSLFLSKFRFIPLGVGFDAPAHLVYIEYLLERGSLPTAAYGFSTYHPPLFYLLTAALHGIFGTGTAVYHAIPFLSGLSNIGLTAWLAKRLWPDQALRPSLAIGAAALLPMNLYMSAYVSNEPLHAAAVGGGIALATGILLADRVKFLHLIALGLTLGAALLTKFTSLALAPVIAFYVGLRAGWLDERGLLGAVKWWAILVGSAGLCSGWFYLRNYLLFGDPLVWNLDVPGAPTWWMRPGFHSAAYFMEFGESISHAAFAGYASFWDGIYSTYWGDGLVAGMSRVSTRHGFWNDDFQALTYPLALPATCLILLGAGRLWVRSFREEEMGRRLVFSMLTTLLFLLGFALILIGLRLPFYAQAKAFYLLAGLIPLSMASAEGLALAAEATSRVRARWLSAVFFGWLGLLGAVIAFTYLG